MTSENGDSWIEKFRVDFSTEEITDLAPILASIFSIVYRFAVIWINLFSLRYQLLYGHTRPYRTIRDHIGINRTIQNYTGPYGTIWNQTGPYRTIPVLTGPCGTIRDHTEKYGNMREHAGPLRNHYGTIWDHKGPYRNTGPYWNIPDHSLVLYVWVSE